MSQIEALEERLFRADEAFVEEKVTPESYARLKAKYEAQLQQARLEREALEADAAGLAEKLQFAVRLLSNQGSVFRRVPVEGKHEVLVRIFPDGLRYEDGSFRTTPESPIIGLFRGKSQKKTDADLSKEVGVP